MSEREDGITINLSTVFWIVVVVDIFCLFLLAKQAHEIALNARAAAQFAHRFAGEAYNKALRVEREVFADKEPSRAQPHTPESEPEPNG